MTLSQLQAYAAIAAQLIEAGMASKAKLHALLDIFVLTDDELNVRLEAVRPAIQAGADKARAEIQRTGDATI